MAHNNNKTKKSNRRNKVPLSGSDRKPVSGAREVGPVDPTENIQVTVILRPRLPVAQRRSPEDLARLPLNRRPRLTREELAASNSASQEDIQKIRQFAGEHGLSVVEADPARRSVVLLGRAGQFADAFDVEMKRFEHPTFRGRTFRGRSGPLYIPESLSSVIQAVLGLDDRPQARPPLARFAPVAESHRFLYSAAARKALRFSPGPRREGRVCRNHRTRWRFQPSRPGPILPEPRPSFSQSSLRSCRWRSKLSDRRSLWSRWRGDARY